MPQKFGALNITLAKPHLFEAQINDNRKQWIHLLPKGKIETVDNRGPFSATDLTSIIQKSINQAKATAGLLPVDYNHSIDVAAPKGQASPAAGWIAKLEARQNGIWGLVEWTPVAFNQVKNKEYRFISPVLASSVNNEVQFILRASLTNNPALTLVSLNSATKNTINTLNEKNQMDEEFLKDLRKALGLTDADDQQAIIDAVTALTNTKTSVNNVDPTKFVPIELFQNTVKELKRVNAGITREAAEREVSAAIADFRIYPFMREWAIELCTVNKPAFDTFISDISSSFTTLEALRGPSPLKGYEEKFKNTNQPKIEKIIASNLGLSDSDIQAFGAKEH